MYDPNDREMRQISNQLERAILKEEKKRAKAKRNSDDVGAWRKENESGGDYVEEKFLEDLAIERLTKGEDDDDDDLILA